MYYDTKYSPTKNLKPLNFAKGRTFAPKIILGIKDIAYCGLPIYTQQYVGAQVRIGTCHLKEEESPNQQ